MSCVIIASGEGSLWGVRGTEHRDTKASRISTSPSMNRGAELYVENDNRHRAQNVQLLLGVVIVEQTPGSATDRAAGPWEDFHATPGGTVNYPVR